MPSSNARISEVTNLMQEAFASTTHPTRQSGRAKLSSSDDADRSRHEHAYNRPDFEPRFPTLPLRAPLSASANTRTCRGLSHTCWPSAECQNGSSSSRKLDLDQFRRVRVRHVPAVRWGALPAPWLAGCRPPDDVRSRCRAGARRPSSASAFGALWHDRHPPTRRAHGCGKRSRCRETDRRTVTPGLE
jgi:hypothetical protein